MLSETVTYVVGRYGYGGLFSLLILGIAGLPVPDEILLTLRDTWLSGATFRLALPF